MGVRSRLGCLTCRRRKKKCDEVKPICTACLRNNLGCLWPAPDPPQRGIAARSNLRQQTSDHGYASEPEPNAWALDSDNVHHDLRLGIVPPSLANIIFPGSVASGPETWRLLDHYLRDTANRLGCLQDGQNPFLRTVLPAALQDELLMHSILAISGVHMMQRCPRITWEMQAVTWSSYTRALKLLRVALGATFNATSHVDSAWRVLLVVLIFFFLEATRGDDPNAMQRHLEGAHHLMAFVMRSNSSCTQPNIVFFTTEIYVYSAALASFTTNCSPTATPIFFSQALSNDPDLGFGVVCGCAHDLFSFIPKVSALLWDLSSNATSPSPERNDLFAQYHDLRSQIEYWKPRSDSLEMIHCAELYRQSILLLLDSRFATEPPSNIIDEAFENLELLLLRLLPSSPIATTTNWPLFAFGIHARNPRQKEMIRSYLQCSIKVFGMGITSTTLNQLEAIWRAGPKNDFIDRMFMGQSELPLIC